MNISFNTFKWNYKCFDNASNSDQYDSDYTIATFGNMTGTVKDSNGNPISGADVLIINQTSNEVAAAETSDANGNWWHKWVLEANFTVVSYKNVSYDGDVDPFIEVVPDWKK